jgi:hypothetical protein
VQTSDGAGGRTSRQEKPEVTNACTRTNRTAAVGENVGGDTLESRRRMRFVI